uniref:Uncharacterized protein n=1 Tax=Arundo donax TaxID=35708 RepID=A0A0A9HX57_ARUDO
MGMLYLLSEVLSARFLGAALCHVVTFFCFLYPRSHLISLV